jgi:hypothetical protein
VMGVVLMLRVMQYALRRQRLESPKACH